MEQHVNESTVSMEFEMTVVTETYVVDVRSLAASYFMFKVVKACFPSFIHVYKVMSQARLWRLIR